MKKLIIFSFLLSCITLSAFNQTPLPKVYVKNNTGYTVYYLYMSQTASDSWEEDELGDEVLTSGETIGITLPYPLKVTNHYDIKLEDEDGDTYTRWDVLVSPDITIEFTIGDLDLDSELTTTSTSDNPEVYVYNNTGYTVYYLYISQTSSSEWEEDVLGDDVLSSGESVKVELAYPLSVANRYDFKLEDEDGDTYTLFDVPVTSGKTIEFTIADLDID